MAIIKCKMCGGDLDISEGMTVAQCEYCGTRQTVPNVDSEKKVTLFSRANRLRLACEFDKAAGVYENLISEFSEEAEAYWGLVLCKYGIEYVDDPATGKKVPTCHRSSFESVLEDSDFEQACENADSVARRVYREEAKAIEEIRKGILEVSGREPPYDIFICYKETDENGERTIDSVLAQDIYDALTEKGYRVFFARITLEDKLGTEYEPYIFAALNSAKVMLVFGTDYEYFNAVWVKNEWSRYLKLMAGDKSKHLIPCYKDVDAYDIPKEFQKLQAQDLGKVGAVQDLLRGIDKLLGKGTKAAPAQPAAGAGAGGPTAASLLERAQMFLEDENWEEAADYFNKVLDLNPRCAEAYVGKMCAENEYTDMDQMVEDDNLDIESPDLKKAIQFAEPALKAKLKGWLDAAEEQRQRDAEQRKQAAEVCKAIRPLAQNLLACGEYHTVGLRADGTVVTTAQNSDSQCNVSNWRNIVAIRAKENYTLGLRTDGTVVAAGKNGNSQCNVSDWSDIVASCAGDKHTVKLRGGSVIANGGNLYGQCNVSSWREIVAIGAGCEYTVGLRLDGTVVATGNNAYGQCNVSSWQDIVAIGAGWCHVVGLRADGTVVATGDNTWGQCYVSSWWNIVAIGVGKNFTVGLRADGTVVATGQNRKSQCNVTDWRLFSSVEELEARQAAICQCQEKAAQRRKDAERRRQEKNRRRWEAGRKRLEEEMRQKRERRAALESEYAALKNELTNLKGLFTGKRRKEIEARLAAIAEELSKL